jgi:hypothetical protein
MTKLSPSFQAVHLVDHLAEVLHGRALEGRQQELALPQVLAPVEDQDRFLAEDGREPLVGLAGVQV